MPTMKVLLQPKEHEALLTLAQRERRKPRVQAAIAIRQRLEELGLLPIDPAPKVDSRPLSPIGDSSAS